MKRSEAIKTYYDEIAEAMQERYHNVLVSEGRCQYKVYVWEDGEIECMCGVSGDNSYLVPRNAEPRELFYVDTVSEQGFDPNNYSDEYIEEDDPDYDKKVEEAICCAEESYKDVLRDRLDAIVDEAEREEEWMDNNYGD